MKSQANFTLSLLSRVLEFIISVENDGVDTIEKLKKYLRQEISTVEKNIKEIDENNQRPNN